MTEQIRQILTDPASADPALFSEIAGRYPYFAIPGILEQKYHGAGLDSARAEDLRLHLALCTGDRRALFDTVGDESEAFDGIYPPEKADEPVSTESAIDTFFATYGTTDSADSALLERLIFNPAPDYSEILARDAGETVGHEAPEGSLESCIDAFVRDHAGDRPNVQTAAPDKVPATAAVPAAESRSAAATDDSLLSESLAKIFIKQGRYERAYEIISNLSLNYPKKSIYFADQLRFLQKLIKIRQAQSRRNDIQNNNKD